MNSPAILQVRDARLDELDSVSQLLKEAYQQYARNMPGEEWAGYLRNIVDVRSRLNATQLIVAETDGKLVGTVTLYPQKGESSQEEWPAEWAAIRLLAVHPEYRDRGIARALMQECIRRCRKQGVKTLALHTTVFMDVARQMYEKMGFRRVPEFDYHPSPSVTILAYRLDL